MNSLHIFTLLFVVFISAFSKPSHAAKVCEIIGFESRDGYYFPVTKCSGSESYVSKSNMWNGSPAGGGFGFAGNYGVGYSSGGSSSSYMSSLPKTSSTESLPSGYKSMSDVQSPAAGYISQSDKSVAAAIERNKEMLKKNEAFNESLRQASAKREAELSRGRAETQARMNQNMAAALILIGWGKAIHIGIEQQANMERQSIEKSKVENTIARNELLKSINDQDEELKNILEPSFNPQNSLNRNEKIIRNKVTDNLRASSDDVGSYLELIDAAIGVSYADNATNESKEFAAGSLAMTIAASEASLNGDTEVSQKFKSLAKVSLDISLGFVPLVSSVNDLSQIGFGIATGRDYTGQEMRGADYAFRAVGMVLGIFPGAKVGQILIRSTFMRGAELLRSYPILAHQFGAIAKLGDRFSVFVSFVGAILPKNAISYRFLKENYTLIPRLADHALDIAKRYSPGDANAIFGFLKVTTFSTVELWQFVHSFEVGSIQLVSLNKGDRLYRWSSTMDAGRFFSPVLIESPDVARSLLALPPGNQLTKLVEFEVKGAAVALKGTVGSNFGYPGGGVQLILNAESVKSVRVVR